MNTREIAILLWVFIIIILAIFFGRKNGVFKSFYGIAVAIKGLFLNPISIFVNGFNFLILIMIYTIMIKFNFTLSIWYIKDYLIILFFSIYPVLEILKNIPLKVLFTEKKKELITLAAIPLFISSTYTSSIFLEMILLFVIAILSMSIVFTAKDKETKAHNKFFYTMMAIIGAFMIFMSTKQLIYNIYDILTLDFWLSFGLEIIVWVINIPVIFIAKMMINIENKIIFSSLDNKVFSYLKYYGIILFNRVKYRKFFSRDNNIKNYILNAKEISAIGGNRILIDLNVENISDHILLVLTFDAIYGKNNHTGITNMRGKYPNVVEIRNSKSDEIGLWEDHFLDKKWKRNDLRSLCRKLLINNIYRINNDSRG